MAWLAGRPQRPQPSGRVANQASPAAITYPTAATISGACRVRPPLPSLFQKQIICIKNIISQELKQRGVVLIRPCFRDHGDIGT